MYGEKLTSVHAMEPEARSIDSPQPQDPDEDAPPEDAPPSRSTKWRNIIAFYLFGLTNNYPYVVMLSAAFDIIHRLDNKDTPSNGTNSSTHDLYNGSCNLFTNHTTNASSYRPREYCEHQGTAIILLADILPTFIIKLTAPYWMHFIPYWIRVSSVTLFGVASFLIIAFSSVEGLVLFGVVCTSIASGFGEIVFLSLTSRYDKSTISAWGAGTGAAGVAGALGYAALTTFLSPRVTLLVQIAIPVIMLVAYLFILGPSKPPAIRREESTGSEQQEISDTQPLIQSSSTSFRPKTQFSIKLFNKEEINHWLAHVMYVPNLFKYMLPLFLVYYSEYCINQTFFELLYNPNTHIGGYCLDQQTQYRWLQVVYQFGAFLARSSLCVIYIRHFWILSLLQMVNFVFFFCATVYLFLPSFWLTFFLIMYEGMLGGGVYVNAFYTVSKEVPAYHREFAMGVSSVGDSFGISLAGVSAIFMHKYICGHFIHYA